MTMCIIVHSLFSFYFEVVYAYSFTIMICDVWCVLNCNKENGTISKRLGIDQVFAGNNDGGLLKKLMRGNTHIRAYNTTPSILLLE